MTTSVHVLRFDRDRTWDDFRQAPAGATYWHPGVSSPTDAAGIPTPDPRSWTVLACWASTEHWRQAQDGHPAWADAAEAWSALLTPGPTRYLPAEPLWAAGTTTNPFGEAQRVGRGPAAVVTTVGLAPEDLDGVLRFVADAEHVAESLVDAPGSEGFRLAAAEHFPSQADPFTFSVWSDLRSAQGWAYEAGVHALAMVRHTGAPHVVRGSFTTFSVVETRGTWSDRHALRRPQVTA